VLMALGRAIFPWMIVPLGHDHLLFLVISETEQ